MTDMRKLSGILLTFALLISCTGQNSNSGEPMDQAHSRDVDVYDRLSEQGIELTEPGAPTASFVLAVRSGDLVFLSGHGPDLPEGGQITGKLGTDDITLEEGQEAARLTGISLLSSLEQEIGDLNKVVKIVKVTGMVNAHPSFTQHSQVINGFSDLMVEVFGESGAHSRASIGMSSLPGNIAVEIDMVVEVRD